MPLFGLLDQHADALRPGAGDRPRGGRRHRGRGERRAHLDRAGHDAREATRAGDGRGVGAGHRASRWCSSAVFVPVAFMPGITGQLYHQFALTIAFSVAALGVQRADAQPGAVRRCCSAHEGRAAPGCVRSAGSTAAFELDHARATAACSALRPARRCSARRRSRRASAADVLPLPDRAQRLRPRRGPGLLHRQRPAARRRVARAHRRGGQQIEDSAAWSTAGHRGRHRHRRLVDRFTGTTGRTWRRLRAPEAVVERKAPRAQPPVVRPSSAPARRHPRARVVVAFSPPPIRGLGADGRLQLHDPGPRRRRSTSSTPATRDVHRGRASKRPELAGAVHDLPRRRARSSASTSIATRRKTLGVPIADVFATLQAYLGGLYVNDFNASAGCTACYVQAERDVPRRRRGHRRCLRPHRDGARWCRSSTLVTLSPSPGRAHQPLQPVSRRRDQRQRRARATARARRIAAMEEVARGLPAGMGYEWTGIAFQEQRGGQRAIIFALSVVLRVPRPGGAVRELVAAVRRHPGGAAGAPRRARWPELRGLANDVYGQIGLVMLIGLAARTRS